MHRTEGQWGAIMSNHEGWMRQLSTLAMFSGSGPEIELSCQRRIG